MDKTKYVEKFKTLHLKTGEELSDLEALEYSEHLVTLVPAITSRIPLDQLIVLGREEREEAGEYRRKCDGSSCNCERRVRTHSDRQSAPS